MSSCSTGLDFDLAFARAGDEFDLISLVDDLDGDSRILDVDHDDRRAELNHDDRVKDAGNRESKRQRAPRNPAPFVQRPGEGLERSERAAPPRP